MSRKYDTPEQKLAHWKIRQRDIILANIGEMTLISGGIIYGHETESIQSMLENVKLVTDQLQREAEELLIFSPEVNPQ